jgi:2-polyprenyl-3-methyl-5-hydroxy-6-metoxy-1,4-benzoquinol methylase
MADRLIPAAYREGRILDIGCGTYPLFLLCTAFFEKYGIDKVVQENYGEQSHNQEIIVINYDIETENTLPFSSEFFDVVSMLAVFEHIEPIRVKEILREIYRVLKLNGMFIMTTPTIWADGLLRFMAKLRLVSPIEIAEHKDAYSHRKISSLLQEAGFQQEGLQLGYFEMFMNIWVAATK